MAIGKDGQFYISVSTPTKSDFLGVEDILELTIIEQSGNALPEFILNFKTEDEDVLRELNEGNLLRLQFGKDQNNVKDISLATTKLHQVNEGSDEVYFELVGFAAEIDYITNHNLQITDKMSGIEAAILVAKNNFKSVDSNVTKSRDKQNWVQPNITDKLFISNCLLRCDLLESFPIYAITADGEFIIRDFKKHIDRGREKAYDWRLTKEVIDPKLDIIYDSDAMMTSQAGLINNWIGYGKETVAYNTSTGAIECIHEDPVPQLALAKELDKAKSINKRFNGSRIMTDSVHAKYLESYEHNLLNLANMSKIDIAVSFSNEFKEIKPLDLIMFDAREAGNTNQASELTSGLYVASKVIRTIQADRMMTTLLLNREMLNRAKNET